MIRLDAVISFRDGICSFLKTISPFVLSLLAGCWISERSNLTSSEQDVYVIWLSCGVCSVVARWTMLHSNQSAAIFANDETGPGKERQFESDHCTNNCHSQTTRQYQYYSCSGVDILTNHALPDELLVQVCSYLHPKSVVSLACLNRSSRYLFSGAQREQNTMPYNRSDTISHLVWKTLWYRDYGNVLLGWEVSRKAFHRSLQGLHNNEKEIGSISNVSSWKNLSLSLEEQISNVLDHMWRRHSGLSMRTFYFQFGDTFINFVLAGQNTADCCLLGMHGHVFDFTHFADHHPGLSDPIRLECGRDATILFEGVPHSSAARMIACKLCVLVNRSCLFFDDNSCGLYRSLNAEWDISSTNTRPPSRSNAGWNLVPRTSDGSARLPPTLQCVRNRVAQELREAKRLASAAYWRQRIAFHYWSIPPQDQREVPKVFFDPFQQAWKGWHHQNMSPVFCDLNWDF